MSIRPEAGERRPVTALFADVVGSTALAESMDPEDWSELVGDGVRRMSAIVERYDGHVGQMLGDGIVAFFGLQPAHEDDPQRAVRAGLDMIDEMRRYSDEARRSYGVRLPIRVGVNTGVVVTRDVGSRGGHPERTALGDPVNVAARIQNHAAPDTVLVTAETYAFVAANVDARHVGRLELKGKSEPVDAYQVIGFTGELARPRGIPGLSSRMVGRDVELGRLASLLEDLARGGARGAVITGEPGIGKTRLINEFRSIAAREMAAGWHEARCPSIGLDLPYHLASRLARSLLGLPENDLGDAVADVPLAPSVADPYLAHLLSLDVPPDDADRIRRLDAAGILGHYVEALRALVEETTREGPAIIVCEDVHWADAASVDLLVRLIPEVRALPVALIVVARADRDTPGWSLVDSVRTRFQDRSLEIHLAPLGPDQGRELVADLLAVESLPDETRRHILAVSDGNPLFIEEVVRMLIEGEAIERVGPRWVARRHVSATDIPDSLHGLLHARLDRLPPEARTLLRIASVIGRRFSLDLLEQVAPAALDGRRAAEHLTDLEAAGMVEVATNHPSGEYVFRHVLIQEAAYASLLRQERSRTHRLTAERLEERHPDRLDELAPVLARHFELGGEIARAIGYLERAGHHAMARFATHEAHDAFARARALVEDDRQDPEVRRYRARLDLWRVEAGARFVPIRESLAILARVREEAMRLGDEDLLAQALLQIAGERVLRGETHESDDLQGILGQGLALATSRGDATLRARLLALSGTARYQAAEYREAVTAYEEALPILEATGTAADVTLHAGHLAVALAQLGDPGQAREWSERARRAAEESGNPESMLGADLARAQIERLQGDAAGVLRYATRAASVADRVDDKASAIAARSLIGEQRLLLGEHEHAIQVLEEGATLSEFCDMVPVRTEFTKALLASALARTSGGAPLLDPIDRVLELARSAGDRPSMAEAFRQRARDGLAGGRAPELVLSDLREAERLFRELEARASLQLTLQEHVRVLERMGRDEEAAGLIVELDRLGAEMAVASSAS